jgi:hypothetical protein
MVFNPTFNNISVISVLLVGETRVPGENHRIYFNNSDVTNLGFILRHFELFYLNTLGFLTTQYHLF